MAKIDIDAYRKAVKRHEAKPQATKPKKAPRDRMLDINPFRAQHGETVSKGMARQAVPPIVTLRAKNDLTQSEYEALDYYRQQATTALDPSPKDSCDFSVRGGAGRGEPPLSVQSAKKETRRLNALLGDLRGIAFAVCVEDKSLTAWACEKHGARERIKNGKVVEMVPRLKDAVFFARWELKFAAARMRG